MKEVVGSLKVAIDFEPVHWEGPMTVVGLGEVLGAPSVLSGLGSAAGWPG